MDRMNTENQPVPAEANEHLEFAEAALALAGHEVTDPRLNDLIARQARGELTGDQARELGRKIILGG
ncbi:MAG: hypothetical protein Q4G21_09625 [Dermabacter sp.]|nr:hypothetical protein [Dermabacter sp.]